jgi:TDG/mug DNA glycosylase family protein
MAGVSRSYRLDRRLPLRLAGLHATLGVGTWVTVEARQWSPDQPPSRLADLLVGAGFDVEVPPAISPAGLRASARRARTLADTVGPRMRVLVCGLNPSVVAADAGYGYAGRSNRFWPAALEAGLVTRRDDPRHALVVDRIGMTDLVKRATPSAVELTAQEFEAGAERVARMVDWLRPSAVLFVGLTGWRAAVDRHAVAGWQERGFAGAAAYVMPSTSGLNAHASVASLVDHMRAVLAS